MKSMTEDSNLFLIDTNILVYAFSQDEGDKSKKSRELIKNCWNGNVNFAVSNQNLAEFIYVSVKKTNVDIKKLRIIIDYVLNFKGFEKIDYSTKTILSAIDIANEFKMSFWDSLLVATMKENSVFNIYTENAKDFKMGWINAVNPFKTKNA